MTTRGVAALIAAALVCAGTSAVADAPPGTGRPESTPPPATVAGSRAVNDGPLRGLPPTPRGGDVPEHAGVDPGLRDLPLDVRPESVDVVTFGPTAGAEVEVTNAAAWHAAGLTGAGVRIGVIDFFDVTRYWDVAEMGPAPVPGVTARCLTGGADCTAEFFDGQDLGGENHGPAVVEIVRDMAPGAEILIGRATTEADYLALVDWFASKGVRVVSRSLGSRYDGPGDGRGALDGVADHAVDRGITWVNSGGNNGLNRYYRQPVRLVRDRVAFGPAGTDVWLRFNGCVSPGGVRWANDWDLPPLARTDYDVVVREAPIGNPDAGIEVARSSARQQEGAPPLELILGAACPQTGYAYYLGIERVAGDPTGDVIEILDYDDGMATWVQAAYSAATPIVDSRNPGVVAVGAVDPPGSGTLGAYSSQGPTNDGRVKPDMSAASGFVNTVLGSFSGTSAAAPVVAGAAALLLDADLATGPRELGDVLRHTVVDRGPAGPDNGYGTGELRLPAPPTATVSNEPSVYTALATPQRVLDTRTTSPIGPPELWGTLWPGEILDLRVAGVAGVPSTGVSAVAVNVTIVGAQRPGYGQLLPTYAAAVGAFSTFNVDAAPQDRPNFAIVPVGDGGRVSVYANTGGDVLVDVLGWFGPAAIPATGGRFVPLEPSTRVLDTRNGARLPVRTDEVVTFGLPATLDAALVSALVVNVTATDVVGQGFVQAFPGGRTEEIYRTSTLNLVDGATSANTVVVPGTASGVSLYTHLGPGGSAHLVADVAGYITSSAAAVSAQGLFVPVRPARAYDSRNVGDRIPDDALVVVDTDDAPGVDVPSGATGVVANLTATGTERYGFVTAWPAGGTEPGTSSLNWWRAGMTVANTSVVRPGGTSIAARVTDQDPATEGSLAHLIVDVFGYFT